MITNPYWVMFSYWTMELLIGVPINNFIYIYNFLQKLNVWYFLSNKASNVAFIIIWNYLSPTNKTPCYMWQQSKLYILIKGSNLSCSYKTYWDSSSFHARESCKWFYQVDILQQGIFLLLTNMKIYNIWWVWSNV
jgi:hypothetical protein